MKSMDKRRRVVSKVMACALVLMLSAATVPAYAADAYTPEAYRVTVYAGNNGTVSVNGSSPASSVELASGVPLNGTADFASLQYQVENEKYYVKGIRLAGIDNIRSDKNTGELDAEGNPVNMAGADTVLYAVPTANGELANTEVRISEDTDFVVAYGILANRVSYTVNYVDTEGTTLREPQTFFGDIGDRPATAPVYIENYIPDASLVVLTLSEDESKNIVTFRYTRLEEGAATIQQPSGRVDVIAPNGSVATGVYTTEATPEAAAAATANEVTTPAAVDSAQPANPVEAELVTTDDGSQVLTADGTPLASPEPQTINDDENALAASTDTGTPSETQAAPWLPWLIAAAVVAALIIFILVKARKKQQEELASDPS